MAQTIDSLWGEEFVVPELTKKILKKIKNPKILDAPIEKQIKSNALSIKDRLALIEKEVLRKLGHFKDNILVIKNKQQLIDYIDIAIKNGIIAIDTETNNTLDYLNCKLVGPCIYTPGQKQVYIPINHVDLETRERLPWQLTEQDVKEQFERLVNTKIIMHNGKFDYQVIHCTCNIDLDIYWDTMVAARLLDENEENAKLKDQYIDKIDPEQEKYNIEELFPSAGGIEYTLIDPDLFAYYASTDAYMTYKLYEWQLNKFKDDFLKGVYWIFRNIEMPLVTVVAKMELEGIHIDKEYAERLSVKYHNKIEDCNKRLQEQLSIIKPKIDAWKLTSEANNKTVNKKGKIASKSKKEQLSDPISLDSPMQLAILIYDILKYPQVSIKEPRGTGVDELTALSLKTKSPLFKIILEKRTLDKLLNTFIDTLPLKTHQKDGKIHCKFNSLGTDTGRFSSSDPNLQQIPRENKEIKPMFKAPEGYNLIFSDLSAAEVRTAANAAKEPTMIKAYQEGQDLYSLVASKIYENAYEDNLEFYPEGTKIMFEGKETICGYKTHTNVKGKIRRQDSKAVLIGLIYGRGAKSIGEQMSEVRAEKGEPPVSKDEAQLLVDNIYKSFPRLKEWMNETHDFIHKYGYIDDLFGRRRRLLDGMLPKYTIKYMDNVEGSQFNPILECKNRVDNTRLDYYNKLIYSKKYISASDLNDIKRTALVEGIKIEDNRGYISQAERQAVNFQAQGASSEINKLSMIAIDKDPYLNSLGVKLILTIHDEVGVICPKEHCEEVAKIIPNIMINVAKDKMVVPLVSDSTIVNHWYQDDVESSLNDGFTKHLKKGLSKEEAIEKICEEHTELLPEQIKGLLLEGRPVWI